MTVRWRLVGDWETIYLMVLFLYPVVGGLDEKDNSLRLWLFFAAVEMRDNPDYRDIPLAVGGIPIAVVL